MDTFHTNEIRVTLTAFCCFRCGLMNLPRFEIKLAVKLYNEKQQIKFDFYHNWSTDGEEINFIQLVLITNRVRSLKNLSLNFLETCLAHLTY